MERIIRLSKEQMKNHGLIIKNKNGDYVWRTGKVLADPVIKAYSGKTRIRIGRQDS